MAVEENLNKSIYKLLILMLKYIPMLISLVYVLNTALSYFYIDIPVLSNLAGMSILPWIFMYLSATVFRFCLYHKMFLHYISESLKRGYSEFPERREKIRNKALGRKMPKDTRCKISLNHSKSNLLKINDEVGSIRYWALKIGKAHSVLSYRLKVHGIDNLRKYIEQRIKLV